MEDLPETRIEMCLKNRALRRLFDKKIKENVMIYEQLDFVESNQGKNQNLVSTRILSNDENLIISEKVNESTIKNENNDNKILQENLMDNNNNNK